MKIAICDDDSLAIENLQQLVCKYQEKINHVIEVTSFTSSAELLATIKLGITYDVYLLDVVMPEVNGISIGKFICDNQKKAKVIFCSVTNEFAVDAFDVRAFYYLLKPLDEEKLFSVLDMVLDIIENEIKQPAYIAVETQDGIEVIQADNVIYCMLDNRRLRYTMARGKSPIESKMLRTSFAKYIESLVVYGNFIQCNSRVVVNICMVSKFESDKVTMKNSDEIPVTRGFKQSLKTAYFSYYFKNIENRRIK